MDAKFKGAPKHSIIKIIFLMNIFDIKSKKFTMNKVMQFLNKDRI